MVKKDIGAGERLTEENVSFKGHHRACLCKIGIISWIQLRSTIW